MAQMDAEQLISVYSESISKSGFRSYPDLKDSDRVLRAENDFLSYLREDFFSIKKSMYAVWVAEGCYLAALRLEPYKDGLLLEALETMPTARRKGYAYNLVTEVLYYLRSTEWKCVYSHIAKRNNPSLCIHKKCGFRIIADSASYIDGTVTQNSFTLRYDL